jgi:uroporphyrinogen-III synthase
MRLLLTRPIEDAAPVADALRARGHEVIVEPLLKISFDRHATLPERSYQAVLVTSANGARGLVRCGAVAALAQTPVFAVGAASAQAARDAGFQTVSSADGDLPALERLVANRLKPANGPLLYAAGRTVSGDLKALLEGHGFEVDRSTLYEAVAAQRLSDAVNTSLVAGALDGVLLFSPRTARVWAELLMTADAVEIARNTPHFCLSEAVVEGLREAFSDRMPPVEVASSPDVTAFLALNSLV